MGYFEKLQAAIAARQSLVCVGLDPELSRLPLHLPRSIDGVRRFLQEIIDATSEFACAYKPNLAFFEALGPAGLELLSATIDAIPSDLPVIGDAKRGDVGNTARQYATALFDQLHFDAVTVNPYLGEDALEPFLDYTDRGIYVLCRTSNPGAAAVQNLMVERDGEARPLYEQIALLVQSWNRHNNCGLVVGATAPVELSKIRDLTPELPLLVPGVGAQGGELAAAVMAHRASAPVVINASRAILYASNDSGFARSSATAARGLRDTIRQIQQG
ncbi:MAG TPA: orotidine-5'-phosphate decarboxylase [Chloroflexota bacterium]|nr:orotidine-5'-phosphate decarboxylase [Chloroflexota bacterium]